MQIKKYPNKDELQKFLPDRKLLVGFEGGSVWLAEKDGRYYVITDEGSMAGFLVPGEDDDLLNQLVKIYEFDSEAERQQYIQERRWNNLESNDPNQGKRYQ